MLKIEGCTIEECAAIYKNHSPGFELYVYTSSGNVLSRFGDVFIIGYRANQGISDEVQAVLDAAVTRRQTVKQHHNVPTSALDAATDTYIASLTPPVDIKALESEEIHAARSVANYILKYGFSGDETLKELTAFHRSAAFALAAATAPPKPTRPELAEGVCRAITAMVPVGADPLVALPHNVREAFKAWQEATT